MAKKAVKELEAGRKKKEAKYITTGSTIRDLIIGGDKGCLGYRVGNIYNVVSDSGSGKTFLSVQSIVANHFILGDKFVWNYDDNEDGNQFDVYSIYGMESPLMDEDTLISNSVEELYVNLRRFKNKVDKDQIGMYVVDSLDGLASQATLDRGNERFEKAEKGKEFTDGTYAMDKQKFLSQEFFPQAMEIINNSNIVLVIISQVRDKINAGMFEKKQTRSGGRALQFYCHTVEWLATVEKKEMEDEETGLRTGIPVLIETTKSRTARPYRKGIIVFDYSIGVDDIASCVDYLYDLRTKNTNGERTKTYSLRPTKKYKLDWDEELFQRDELCDYIYDNELESELRKRVIDKWEAEQSALKNRRKPRFK